MRRRDAALDGLVRWCPICDGYEVLDKDVAVLGPPRLALGHALFLRTCTRSLALLVLPDRDGLAGDEIAGLEAAGVELIHDAAINARPGEHGGIEIEFAAGLRRRFDTLYPMQGCRDRPSPASVWRGGGPTRPC